MNNSSMTSIVINADDFGISDGVCEGILDLLSNGAISNTTIMVSAFNALKFFNKWNVKALRGIAGIHLQLTGGIPVSPIEEISSLIDPTSGNFFSRESFNRINLNPSHVEKEWRRQIEVGTNFLGGLPTHLDSHQGVHRLPKFSEIYLSLASEYAIPVRGGTDRAFFDKMKNYNVQGSALILRDWTGKNLNDEKLIELLEQSKTVIQDDEIIEVVTHPGYSDCYLESISTLNKAREFDLKFLIMLSKQNRLADNGFTLVAYPSLKNK